MVLGVVHGEILGVGQAPAGEPDGRRVRPRNGRVPGEVLVRMRFALEEPGRPPVPFGVLDHRVARGDLVAGWGLGVVLPCAAIGVAVRPPRVLDGHGLGGLSLGGGVLKRLPLALRLMSPSDCLLWSGEGAVEAESWPSSGL